MGVLLFSDPMVDVFAELGSRTSIPAFYVSFLLAPMASNASELIAAYNYAAKKTKGSIQVSLSTLEGAGIMNNTFCLGIFFILMYMQEIPWTYNAEALCIVIAEIGVAIVAQKKFQTLSDACFVLTLYPFALLFVI